MHLQSTAFRGFAKGVVESPFSITEVWDVETVQFFISRLLQHEMAPIALGQIAVLLVILLFLVKWLWISRLSPVQRLLYKLGFQTDHRPNERIRREAWDVIGAWKDLPGGMNALRWIAKGSVANKPVQVFEHGTQLQGVQGHLPGFVIFAASVKVRYRGITYIPAAFDRENGESVLEKVPEQSGELFDRYYRMRVDRSEADELVPTQTMQAVLLSLPRCCQVAMGEGSVCIGIDARVARRECKMVLAKLAYLADLVDATAPEEKAKPVQRLTDPFELLRKDPAATNGAARKKVA
jgi:hypothetical protein